MWSLMLFLLLTITCSEIETLTCYQCSMKYSNVECNANNLTYYTECQPTFDTCLTLVLKPDNFDEIIITKYCTKRHACERQQNYTHSVTPCDPNNEGRSWGCVSCCGDRDLCNYDDSNRLISHLNIAKLLLFSILHYFIYYLF
ncbi:unnamed protein product [Rotaria magnacalcarata]|uniref:Uncharacterized protein n=2 Tax=Rotaria magnacalcarata TaxID=392030 RepID=A0A816TU33_9BILA|nr:unnamed protein product [Rotaria magnacalcarata]CAF2136356.1 unnamed protein product [Rotaria magnacalcarata]